MPEPDQEFEFDDRDAAADWLDPLDFDGSVLEGDAEEDAIEEESVQLPIPIQRRLENRQTEPALKNPALEDGRENDLCPLPRVEGAEKRPPKKIKPVRPDKLSKSTHQLERARRRQMTYLKKRREQKRLRVFYGRVRATMKFLFAILWMVLIAEIVQSPLWNFTVPIFSLHGNRLLTSAQVKPLVTEWQNQPFYAVDTGKMAAQLKDRYAVIDQVSVRRAVFPMRLEIIIREKQPWAALYNNRKLLEANREPVALVAEDESMILLESYQYSPSLYPPESRVPLLANPNQRLTSAQLEMLEQIAYRLQHVPDLRFHYLDVRKPELVVARFRETYVILGRLDEGVYERMARLAPVVPKLRELKDVVEGVDLRWSGQVLLRNKPGAQLPKPPGEEEGTPVPRG